MEASAQPTEGGFPGNDSGRSSSGRSRGGRSGGRKGGREGGGPPVSDQVAPLTPVYQVPSSSGLRPDAAAFSADGQGQGRRGGRGRANAQRRDNSLGSQLPEGPQQPQHVLVGGRHNQEQHPRQQHRQQQQHSTPQQVETHAAGDVGSTQAQAPLLSPLPTSRNANRRGRQAQAGSTRGGEPLATAVHPLQQQQQGHTTQLQPQQQQQQQQHQGSTQPQPQQQQQQQQQGPVVLPPRLAQLAQEQQMLQQRRQPQQQRRPAASARAGGANQQGQGVAATFMRSSTCAP